MGAPWYRKPLCLVGLCQTFCTASDDDGVWGECSICQKRAGYVDRATLRRVADAEAARDAEEAHTGVP